jgi:uncharacterized protein YdcH (DUF465 family)
MVGKIFITRSGYDPQVGKHVKDPYLGPVPTLGACRPDIREQLGIGDHIFVISGKVSRVNQFVMGGFEIASKVPAAEAYRMFPELRLQRLPDGQLTGNIIVGPDGRQHALDDHNSFDRRIKNYVIGSNRIAVETADEIAQAREQTTEALSEILKKRGKTPLDIVGRWGSKLSESQVLELRDWLMQIKRSRKGPH